MKINPYLNFPGTTEEAFKLYRSVFGGEFVMIQRFKDTPEASKIPAAELDKIMHISLLVGDSVIMATDALESMGQKIIYGNNNYISLSVDSKEETDRIFAALSVEGKVEMAPTEMFWGAYFCIFTDKYGIQWMINCDGEGKK